MLFKMVFKFKFKLQNEYEIKNDNFKKNVISSSAMCTSNQFY